MIKRLFVILTVVLSACTASAQQYKNMTPVARTIQEITSKLTEEDKRNVRLFAATKSDKLLGEELSSAIAEQARSNLAKWIQTKFIHDEELRNYLLKHEITSPRIITDFLIEAWVSHSFNEEFEELTLLKKYKVRENRWREINEHIHQLDFK